MWTSPSTGPRSEAQILRDEERYFESLRMDELDEMRDVAADEGVSWPPIGRRTFKASGFKVPRAWFELPDPNGWDGKDPF